MGKGKHRKANRRKVAAATDIVRFLTALAELLKAVASDVHH
jgi:hypothetical protein